MTETDLPFDTAKDRLPEVLGSFDVPPEVEHTAEVLADVASDPTIDWVSGTRAGPLATACLYVADYAVRQGDRYTQSQLVREAPGTHVTIRKYYRELPRIFLEHATGEQRDQLDDRVLDVLEVFRDAEQVGLAATEIEPWLDPREQLDN